MAEGYFSNDETQKIVEGFKSEKIIYEKVRNNGVIAKSRNTGIKISRGKWLAFLDSDDYWYSERLQKVSEFLLEKLVLKLISQVQKND